MSCFRCGNVAAILELDEHLQRDFTIFEAAPQVNEQIFPDLELLCIDIISRKYNVL